MKRTFVDGIVKDAEVKDFFLVVRKAVYSAKNGGRYGAVRLKDRTGSIEARIWDRVDELCGCFERNDIVRVEGRSKLYQGELQLNVTAIRREAGPFAACDIGDFYAETPAGIEASKAAFERIVGSLSNVHLAALFGALKGRTEVLDRFFLFPASIGVHHMCLGGLLEHSVTVADLGVKAASLMGADADVVAAGSLLHDLGKTEEMELKSGAFGYCDKGRLLGHITLGILMLDELVAGIEGFPAYLSDVLKHIVLSHHGEAEWGSPKKPMCAEALVVHYIDNLDAKVMGVKEHLDAAMEDERWSQFHRLYESRFYKIPER